MLRGQVMANRSLYDGVGSEWRRKEKVNNSDERRRHLESSLCEFFEEIFIVTINDADIKELELWRRKDPFAFDWSPTSKLLRELKGMSSDGYTEEEENLRRKIKKVMKWKCTDGTQH
ncbi:nicotinamide N-methyltransferase-like isoform X2 [Dendropsophus ebraccatus]|uniref:nicotinamide N-methyltransferase-like isoform X2 n=1 Tax=Dendropsophus ebraccatus TaxID=150705 RepID=UPI003831E8B0